MSKLEFELDNLFLIATELETDLRKYFTSQVNFERS